MAVIILLNTDSINWKYAKKKHLSHNSTLIWQLCMLGTFYLNGAWSNVNDCANCILLYMEKVWETSDNEKVVFIHIIIKKKTLDTRIKI